MKHVCMICAALLFVGLVPTSSQTGEVTLKENASAMPNPDREGKALFKLSAGSKIVVSGVEGEWLKSFSRSTNSYWIHKDATDILPIDFGIVTQEIIVYDRRGYATGEPHDNAVAIDTLVANVTVPVSIHQSGWYNVRLANGRNGWVAQTGLSRSPLVLARAKVTVNLASAPDGRKQSISKIEVKEGERVVITEYRGRFAHIRLSNGAQGWVFDQFVGFDDTVPDKIKDIAAYRFMQSIEMWGTNGWKSFAVFVLFWFVLPALFAMITMVLSVLAVGSIPLFPNWFVKIVPYFGLCAGLAVLFSTIGMIYPYTESFLATMSAFATMIAVSSIMFMLVDRMRCRNTKCRKLGGHRLVDTKFALGNFEVTYRGGHVRNEKHGISTYIYECPRCHTQWESSMRS